MHFVYDCFKQALHAFVREWKVLIVVAIFSISVPYLGFFLAPIGGYDTPNFVKQFIPHSIAANLDLPIGADSTIRSTTLYAWYGSHLQNHWNYLALITKSFFYMGIFSVFSQLSLAYVSLHAIRHKKLSYKNLFKAYKLYFLYASVLLLFWLSLVPGLFLFFLPQIVIINSIILLAFIEFLAVTFFVVPYISFQFYSFVVLDEKKGAVFVLKKSLALTKKEPLLLAFVTFLLFLITQLLSQYVPSLPYVGNIFVLFIVPMMGLTLARAYDVLKMRGKVTS